MSRSHHTGHGRCGACGDSGENRRKREASWEQADVEMLTFDLLPDIVDPDEDSDPFGYDYIDPHWDCDQCNGWSPTDEDYAEADRLMAVDDEEPLEAIMSVFPKRHED